MVKAEKNVPIPSPDEVNMYLDKWSSLNNYVLQESSLRKLFTITYPANNEMDDILIKVCTLNDFYSTNIYAPFKLAKHIQSLHIDERLAAGDDKLVNQIAIGHGIGNNINLYSFATKYCSHHKPEVYPIYDSYVEKMLLHFKGSNNSFDFDKKDLKQYPIYKLILNEFMSAYGLRDFTLKDIDRYLWQAGKEYFPKKYLLDKKKTIQAKGVSVLKVTKISQILNLHKLGKTNQEIIAAGFNKNTVGIQVAKYKRENRAI